MGRSRDIATFLSKTEQDNTSNLALLNSGSSVGLDSAQVTTIATDAGIAVYTALDSLPSTGLSSGDQAWVESSGRLYISNGSGWYNIALVNSAPYWDSEPLTTYDIADSATALVITAKALDSDNPASIITHQSFASDSAAFLVDITRDSSVFTFTPKSQDSIGASVTAGDLTDSNTNDFIYTFKWSDGINFVSKAVTINYNFFNNLDPFGDASLIALYELDGNGNDAVGSNDTTGYRAGSGGFDTGTFKYGTQSFGGGNNILDLPDVKTTYPLTMSAWLYHPNVDVQTDYNVVVNATVGSQRLSMGMYRYSGASQMQPVAMFGGGDHIEFTGGPTLADNTWFHVVWSLSAYESGAIHVNGTKLTVNNRGGTHGGTAGWSLGGNYAGSEHFDGHIDRVRIFNKAISDSEAVSLYNSGG